jgi:hypothetical protein
LKTLTAGTIEYLPDFPQGFLNLMTVDDSSLLARLGISKSHPTYLSDHIFSVLPRVETIFIQKTGLVFPVNF